MGMSYLQEAIFKRIYHTWNVGRLYNVQPYVIALSIYPLQSHYHLFPTLLIRKGNL